MKRFIAMLSILIMGMFALPAVYQTVVVQEAGWQHYSYNGRQYSAAISW